MKKITILGSAKDYDIAAQIAKGLENNGFYIFMFKNARELRQTPMPESALKLIDKGLIYAGFDRIKKADYVLFINFNGYMGNSTTLELGYAAALSKHIISLNHDTELTREALFTDILETENIDEIVKRISEKFK